MKQPRTKTTPLHPHEEWLLLALQDYARRQPYPPTIRELMEICGFSSTSVCFYWLTKLQRRGIVDWEPGAFRTTCITRGTTLREWWDRGIRRVEVVT